MCEDRGRDSKVVVASASNPLCEEGMWSRIDCGFHGQFANIVLKIL